MTTTIGLKIPVRGHVKCPYTGDKFSRQIPPKAPPTPVRGVVGHDIDRCIRSSEVYTLTDNRLISYRSDFCANLRANSTQGTRDIRSNATLAFLRSPPLTGREAFSLSESINLHSTINFNSWNFYLKYNSDASIYVCYQDSNSTDYPDSNSTDYSVTFYIIKSANNFIEWRKKPDRSDRTVRSMRLDEQCTTISYRVTEDEVYYFVFYLSGQRSTSLDIDFDFNRTLYKISSDMVVKNCSFPLDGRSGCTLDAPMTPGYTGFLSLNANPPVDYNDKAGISISCSPRGWLYAVIVLVVVFVTLGLPCTCVAVCFILLLKRDTNRSEDPTSMTNVTTRSVHYLDEPSTVTNESIQLREHPSNVPDDSALSKDEPPSYSDAAEYSNVESNDAPPPSYEDS